MPKPEVGGRYLELSQSCMQHGFDGVELANTIAPICRCCDAWILGEGVQLAGQVFCGVECAWLAIRAA